MTGERLLARLDRAGDDGAFERLIEPLQLPAYHLAFAVLRNREAAEDAVQEATVRAWRCFGQLRDGGKARPWFLKIVLNQCRRTMRARWWSWHLFGDRVEVQVDSHQAGVETRLDLERAIAQLSRQHRAVLFLFFQMDLSHEEIARVLGIQPGTVKSRLHRAMGRLRSAIVQEREG